MLSKIFKLFKEQNDDEITKYINEITSDNIDFRDEEGNTLIHYASTYNSPHVNYLIAQNCDINVQNERGNTPLHIACAKHHCGLINLLILCEADINIENLKGKTPVFYLSDPHLIEIFYRIYDADLNWVDLDLQSVLHKYSKNMKHKELLMKCLKLNTTDIHFKDKDNNTFMHLLFKNYDEDLCLDVLGSTYDLWKILEIENIHGDTLLSLSKDKGQLHEKINYAINRYKKMIPRGYNNVLDIHNNKDINFY